MGSNPKWTSDELKRRAVQRRAVEAVIWGMPAVNTDLMYQALVQLKGGFNQIVYWSGLPSWKNQTLTPNPDSIYLMPFHNTKDGPMVLEIPPSDTGSITGSIMDCWQTPLEDVGPAGVDKGKGGKYLILPPNYREKVPDGYIPLPSLNFQGYTLARSILKSGSKADVEAAVAYGRRIKLYSLSQAANAPATKFVDALNSLYDATIPYDVRFFKSLDRIVQQEPWLPRDKAMIDQVKSLGIEKGKTFAPDAVTEELLNAGAAEAQALLESQYSTAFASPFYPDAKWALPAVPGLLEGMESMFVDPNHYPVDGRGLTYSFAFFCAKHMGAGQYYLMTIKDKAGQDFDGGSNYRLTVPANAPVRQYWSATVYDRATHALIRNQPWSSRSSQTDGLKKNADGSVTLYFGPKVPGAAGDAESNWVPTSVGGLFEVLFRLYGPDKSFFDKTTWKLPDIEKVTIGAAR